MFSKWSCFSGLVIWWGTWKRRRIAFDLFLFLKVTSGVCMDTVEGHARRSWYPHHARSQKGLDLQLIATLLLRKTLNLP